MKDLLESINKVLVPLNEAVKYKSADVKYAADEFFQAYREDYTGADTAAFITQFGQLVLSIAEDNDEHKPSALTLTGISLIQLGTKLSKSPK